MDKGKDSLTHSDPLVGKPTAFESSMYPPITLITGPRESGRTTYAVQICAELFKQGVPCFHNSTALFGWNIEECADAYDGLLTLAESIPQRSTILIEEAEAKEATRQTGEPSHEATINSALATLAEKACQLVLTTVQGNEGLIAKPLVQHAFEHVTPYMEAGSQESVALGTMHRFGRYMIPVGQRLHDPESVRSSMMLANTFKEMRKGAPEGKNVEYTEDRLFEVSQTSIDQMKYPRHPEYPVYYRHRIVRPLPNGSIHRLTEDSILYFTWLESVNEHPNETVALEMLARTMPQWGFEYQPLATVQDTNFPDGQALINGELANLEVVSIQPRYAGGHNLHDLVALTQAGRAEKLEAKAVLRCQTCHAVEPLEDITLQNLPNHDDRHRWVMYLPGSIYAPDFPSNLAATPLLTIRQEDFTNELEAAIRKKSEIIAAQGEGLRNWVVALVQGFPTDAAWYSELLGQWPENVDGICVVATEGYVGACSHMIPYKDIVAVLLKCPPDVRDHNCYHPGYSYRVSGIDTNFQPLSRDSHTIEEVSAAAWKYPLLASPVKRTLILRDQDGREIQSFLGADVTDSQVRGILEAAGYKWREQSLMSFVFSSEGDTASQDGCWAEVQRLESEEWIGLVSYEGYQCQEECKTVEEAKGWCERHAATLLLHME